MDNGENSADSNSKNNTNSKRALIYLVISFTALVIISLVLLVIPQINSSQLQTRPPGIALSTAKPSATPTPSSSSPTPSSSLFPPLPWGDECRVGPQTICILSHWTEDDLSPGEFELKAEWDRIADAQCHGDTRSVRATLDSHVLQTPPCELGDSNLANQCGQPDGNIVFGISKPVSIIPGTEITDETYVQLHVYVDPGLKIIGWENCPMPGDVEEDGQGNVTHGLCFGRYGELRDAAQADGSNRITVKVRSAPVNGHPGRNAGENWEDPSCPDDPDCPRPTCNYKTIVDEDLGEYSDQDGHIMIAGTFPEWKEALILSAYAKEVVEWVAEKNKWYVRPHYQLKIQVGKNIYKPRGSMTQLLEMFREHKTPMTPKEFKAMFAATRRAMAAAASGGQKGGVLMTQCCRQVVSAGGGVQVLAKAMTGSTISEYILGGGIVITEIAVVGWEINDITQSKITCENEDCEEGTFFTCGEYWHYTNPWNWNWEPLPD
ncbi:MAG: hypothetical protein JXA33_12270 [Anaerolineae bacterium]|nr:hypothetical protein [Anaerolineae bacterium]